MILKLINRIFGHSAYVTDEFVAKLCSAIKQEAQSAQTPLLRSEFGYSWPWFDHDVIVGKDRLGELKVHHKGFLLRLSREHLTQLAVAILNHDDAVYRRNYFKRHNMI